MEISFRDFHITFNYITCVHVHVYAVHNNDLKLMENAISCGNRQISFHISRKNI